MPDSVTFNFAWVDDSETTFVAGTHAREDEQIFSLEIAQAEGEFATAEIVIENPGEGLLNPARKQYAWISVTADAVTTALFFGRVTAFPRDLSGPQVTLEFTAQFPGWEAARAALFASLQFAPYWDEAFIPASELENPDQALEARSALYHYDRLTGAITLSDIITGTATTAVSDQIDGSVGVDLAAAPAKKVTVSARVEWEQHIIGESDAPHFQIRKEFGGAVNSFTGPGLERAWPSAGDTIGGQSGYQVTFSSIKQIDPLPAAMPEQSDSYKAKITDAEQAYAKALFSSVQTTRDAQARRYWYDTALTVGYSFRQQRSETITFTVDNDAQALAFDADGGETKLDLQAEDVVGLALIPARWSTYFLTSRGKDSFQYLLARARAELARSSRAVEVSFERPFFNMLDVSCKNAYTLSDASLPGGTATGKIKSWKLSVDGATGTTSGQVTIAVAVGNGAAYAAAGTSGKCAVLAALVAAAQETDGEQAPSPLTDMIYEPYDAQLPDDPPIVNRIANDDLIASLTINNGPDAQAALLLANQFPVREDAAAVLNENPTAIALTLRSLEPFDTVAHTITVTITQPWAAPKGIDLAA
jgi:hypothetical protein